MFNIVAAAEERNQEKDCGLEIGLIGIRESLRGKKPKMKISLATGLALSQCSMNLTLLYYCSFSAEAESYSEVVLSGNRSKD